MSESEEVVEPLHLELEDREVYLAKIPVCVGLHFNTRFCACFFSPYLAALSDSLSCCSMIMVLLNRRRSERRGKMYKV